jgi:hypothetical protein
MENNQTGLAKLSTPIGFNETTGMSVYESFTATSGFNYMVGVREANELLIVEQFAEGTGCTYLCGILIYQKSGNVLLKDISVPRYFHYTRMEVMKIVRQALLDLLLESSITEQKVIDMESADKFVSTMLDKCYFEISRKTIIEWAKTVGIIKN